MTHARDFTMRRFDNKVCLVTGAASGIGRATALRLAAEGASIAAGDINEAGLKSLAVELAERGAPCMVIPFNALEEASNRALVHRALAQFGRLDVLCNIAGACRADHFQHSDLPLLAAYARAVVAELVAAGELAAANLVDDTPA